MRKNVKKMMAWLLISGVVTTSSGFVALANDSITVQNSLIASKEATEILYLTQDMASNQGTIVVEDKAYDCIVIPKELQTTKIILKNIFATSLEVESGTDCIVDVKGGTIGEVVVLAPKMEEMGHKEINALLESGMGSVEVAELYRAYQVEKKKVQAQFPTIVTDSKTSIATMKISGSVSLNLSKNNVTSIEVESVSNQGKMQVEIANYTGSVSVKQEKEAKKGNNLLNLTLTDSIVTNLDMNSTGGSTCYIKEKGTSKVETVEVKGDSRVNLSVPVETVTVTEQAKNAFVKLYSDAKEMVVEGTKAQIMLSASATVENAVVSGDNVKIYGYGKLNAAEIVGEEANVSTSGTKVEGENDKTVPSNVVTPEPTSKPSKPKPTQKPSVTPTVPPVPTVSPDDTEQSTPGALVTPTPTVTVTPDPTEPPKETITPTPSVTPELEETSAEYFEWEENEDGTIKIVGFWDEEETITSIVIPKEIEGKKVTIIEYIGDSSNIKQIVLPNTVTTVEDGAFDGCNNLRELYISESVEYFCGLPEYEGFDLFFENYVLKTITVAENNKVFASQDGILYSKDMTKLLYVPRAYEGVYEFPSTVKGMNAVAFDSCENITEIIIPASFTMWSSCDGLDSLEKIIVEDGNPVYCSEDNILFSKDKTKLWKIPANAVEDSYVIPETVKEIDEYAFSDCTSLTSVTISKNVSAVVQTETVDGITFEYKGQNYFKWCTSLETIEVVEENPNYMLRDGILFSKDGTCLVAVPRKHSIITEGYGNYIVPEDVTHIGCGAFYNSKLETIELPEGLEVIGSAAFQGCDLRSIEISAKVIGKNAFGFCSNLERVYIYEGATIIESGAFSSCRNLMELYIPESVIIINGRITSSSSRNLIIFAYPGSVAEEYAEKYGIPIEYY